MSRRKRRRGGGCRITPRDLAMIFIMAALYGLSAAVTNLVLTWIFL